LSPEPSLRTAVRAESFSTTSGANATVVPKLDQIRKKRNLGEYALAGRVSDQEAAEMLKLAIEPRDKVKAWLGKTHRNLLPK
jgi:hypothetical protein